MSAELFAALEQRFNANPALVTVGRKLYQGFDEERKNVVRPYTELNMDMTERFDAWNGTDIEAWDVRFRYHAKDLQPNAASAWRTEIRRSFKEAKVTSHAFTCCGTRERTESAPMNRMG